MTRKKKLEKIVKKVSPNNAGEPVTAGKTNLLGYMKVLIEMEMEANYPKESEK